jgi:hypothetical protein
MIFYYLCKVNIRFLPVFMLAFSIAKQSYNVFFEGRISVPTLKFTLAYLTLCFKKDLTIDEFVAVLCGIGVIF